MLALHRYRWY